MLEHLKKESAQGELLTIFSEEFKISIENWDLQELSAQNLTKRALRVMKDGLQGSNYSFGSSSLGLQRLMEGALESVVYGSKAYYDFSPEVLDTKGEDSRSSFEKTNPDELFSFLTSFMDTIRERNVDLSLNINLGKDYREYSILTTRGGDLKDGVVNYHLFFSTPIPGGGSNLYRGIYSPHFFTSIPEEEVESFLLDYSLCQQVSVPKTGRLPVIFSPRSLYFLPVCLGEGISGSNIYRQTSPLQDKMGEEIFSSQLTIKDEPHQPTSPHRRTFDDEGIPTTQKVIVEKGVLKEFIYDLEYAARLKKKPKGNGLKQGLFGGDIDSPINPSLVNPVIQPGTSSREEMIKDLDEGIIVEQIIGFHSSNYPQGHFSVQAHGFHVQGGEVKGRLEDVMIAGNVYEDFKRVEKIGTNLYNSYYGFAPYMLVDGVSVTGR